MAKKLTKKNTKLVQKVVKKARQQVAQNNDANKAGATQTYTPPKTKYVEGVGRRKVATARVRLYETKDGKAEFIVNNMAAGQYFDTVLGAPALYNKPLETTDLKGKFIIVAKTNGSGKAAQLDAVVHGLSRALIKYNANLQPLLKAEGFLTRDARMKETRKIGTGGKARRKRQSPKR